MGVEVERKFGNRRSSVIRFSALVTYPLRIKPCYPIVERLDGPGSQ